MRALVVLEWEPSTRVGPTASGDSEVWEGSRGARVGWVLTLGGRDLRLKPTSCQRGEGHEGGCAGVQLLGKLLLVATSARDGRKRYSVSV